MNTTPNEDRGIIVGNLNINVLLAFAFGIIFVTTMLVFAVVFKDPTESQQRVFITVLALAAAGVGAIIPGLLEVEIPFVKAGGAIALFVIVYAMRPQIVVATHIVTIPTRNSAPEVASEYMAKVDADNFDGAFSLLDPEAPAIKDKATYLSVYRASRGMMGKELKRTGPIGFSDFQTPSGWPVGVYRTLTYRTEFQGNSCRDEAIMLRGRPDGYWRVWEQQVSTNASPCNNSAPIAK